MTTLTIDHIHREHVRDSGWQKPATVSCSTAKETSRCYTLCFCSVALIFINYLEMCALALPNHANSSPNTIVQCIKEFSCISPQHIQYAFRFSFPWYRWIQFKVSEYKLFHNVCFRSRQANPSLFSQTHRTELSANFSQNHHVGPRWRAGSRGNYLFEQQRNSFFNYCFLLGRFK